jgi:hypothetical protein
MREIVDQGRHDHIEECSNHAPEIDVDDVLAAKKELVQERARDFRAMTT